MTNKITFDNLPEAVQELLQKVDRLSSQLKLHKESDEADKLFDIDELIAYLPEHPAKQTVYGKKNDRKIPFEKHGKKLYFRKSAIDKWLANGRQI